MFALLRVKGQVFPILLLVNKHKKNSFINLDWISRCNSSVLRTLKRRESIMPIVNVNMMEGRPKEKIEKVIADVTETISSTLEVPKESVRVLVTEVPKSHWGIAGESVEKRNASK
ncbi:4-oxalocrotonate tautomerase [Halalkalibacter flavus]|uniref:4-oxalocrotonate tautomerase n=1 Tax=Halalkalibacter flavus TaxID=3090668 RepID=UPI002FC5B634